MGNHIFDTLRHVNYKAVTVLAVAAFMLGGVWYSPIGLEQAWILAHGYTAADTAQIIERLVPFGFVSTFFAYFLTCLVTAMLCLLAGVHSWRAGATLGIMVWVGYAAAIGLTTNLFSSSTITGWWIDAGFQFLFLVTAGAVLGAWQSESSWHTESYRESAAGSASQF